jgi:hypothetical protein
MLSQTVLGKPANILTCTREMTTSCTRKINALPTKFGDIAPLRCLYKLQTTLRLKNGFILKFKNCRTAATLFHRFTVSKP